MIPVSMDAKAFRSKPWLEWLTWLLLAASCCYLLASLLAYGIGEPFSGNAFIHSLRMKPPFADLRYLAANAVCGVDLNDYYAGRVVGCDPSGRTYPFDYPPMSIWLGRFLHVQGGHVPLIAVSTGVALIVCIVLGLKSCLGYSWQWRLLSSGVLMGYPLQQALERGNLDILLLLLSLLLAYLLTLRFKTSLAGLVNAGVAGLIAFLLVSLKLYPIFGLVALLVQRSHARSSSFAVTRSFSREKFAVLFGSVLGIVATFPFLRGMNNVAKEGGLRSHGLLAFGYINNTLIGSLGVDSARIVIKALLLIKLLSLLLGFYLAWKTRLHEAFISCWQSWDLQRSIFCQNVFVLMSAVWLGCYLTTINIDYRLLFLIPWLGLLARVATVSSSSLPQRRWAAGLIVSMLVVFWVPLLQWGYTDFGMKLIPFAEPLTEFVLLPVCAASLAYLLIEHTWSAFRA
jgi:hypothetical protein